MLIPEYILMALIFTFFIWKSYWTIKFHFENDPEGKDYILNKKIYGWFSWSVLLAMVLIMYFMAYG